MIEGGTALTLVPLGAALFLAWQLGTPLPREGTALSLLSTLVFASIVLMQMLNAYECRSSTSSVFSSSPLSNRLLAVAVLAELLILFAFVYEPRLRQLLHHQPLALSHWVLVAAAPCLLLIAEELRKLIANALTETKQSNMKEMR